MNISDQVQEETIGNCRLLLLPTAVNSVVSFYGSFATRPALDSREDVLQDLAVSLLDKGTLNRDKFAIAEELESRGAEIKFHSLSTRIAFSGKCLKDDIRSVFGICAEQLREPAMANDEFDKVLPRIKASVMQSMESTGTQAGSALRRLLFSDEHPNYAYSPETELEILSEIEVSSVSRYYENVSGGNEFVLVVAGDFDSGDVIDAVRDGFDGWKSQSVHRTYEYSEPSDTPQSLHIPMKDKQNVDVRIGHVIDITRSHDDYLPLYLGIYVLGGNFSSRLMDTIRDKEGLTYGIHSNLNSVSSEFCGYFLVSATFSSETLDKGVERTNDLISHFASDGVTADELASKKRTVSGSYKVGLASTGSLARTIGVNVVSGLGVSYVDQFASLIDNVSLDDVNSAVKKWINDKSLRTATAGTASS